MNEGLRVLVPPFEPNGSVAVIRDTTSIVIDQKITIMATYDGDGWSAGPESQLSDKCGEKQLLCVDFNQKFYLQYKYFKCDSSSKVQFAYISRCEPLGTNAARPFPVLKLTLVRLEFLN